MVGDKGFGSGIISNYGYYRSFNFEEILCVKVFLDVVDDFGMCDKDVLGVGVYD